MTDDKRKTGAADRQTVSAEEPYEVVDFAEEHGLSMQQVRDLIAKVGNRREDLEKAAAGLKR